MDLREEFKTNPLFKKLLLAILREEMIKLDEMLTEFPEIPEEVLKNCKYPECFDPFDKDTLATICPSLIEVVDSDWEGYREDEYWVWEIPFQGAVYQFHVDYDSWNGRNMDDFSYVISHARKGKMVPKMIQVFEQDV